MSNGSDVMKILNVDRAKRRGVTRGAVVAWEWRVPSVPSETPTKFNVRDGKTDSKQNAGGIFYIASVSRFRDGGTAAPGGHSQLSQQ